MSNADAHTQTPQYTVAGDQTAVRELQRVLSLYLPSFYGCAFRVLVLKPDHADEREVLTHKIPEDNVIAIPAAAGMFTRWEVSLPKSVGAMAMNLSTIIVALNGQLLRRVQLGP